MVTWTGLLQISWSEGHGLQRAVKFIDLVFDNYFLSSKKVHHYNTMLPSKHAYAIPTVRTNYVIFNIEFVGAKV